MLLAKGAQKLTGVGARRAQRLWNKLQSNQRQLKFERAGITNPSAATVSGNRGLARLEAAIEQSAMGAQELQRAAGTTIAQTQKAVDDVARRFGEPRTTKFSVGEVVQDAAQGAIDRFKSQSAQRYDDVFEVIGADTPVPLNAVKQQLMDWKAELARAPARARSLAPAIKRAEALVANADIGLRFDDFRQLRTDLRRDLVPSQGSLTAKDSSDYMLDQLHDAMTRDMSNAASSVSDEAFGMLKAADAEYARFMAEDAGTLNNILKIDAEERAFKILDGSTRDNSRQLEAIRRNLTENEWGVVASSVIKRMGLAKPSAQDAAGDAFSVNTFMTSWNNIAPESKDVLFGGSGSELRQSLDDLVDVVDAMKDVSRYANTSNTAGALHSQLMFQTLALGGGVAFIDGTPETVGATVLGSVLAPKAAARLMTNPRFVKWLATPPLEIAERGIAEHIGQLAATAVDEPGFQEDVRAYIGAVQGFLADLDDRPPNPTAARKARRRPAPARPQVAETQ